MYLPTVAKVIAKRTYGDDFNFAFESHTGKRFQEDVKYEYGVDINIGDFVYFENRALKKVDSYESGMKMLLERKEGNATEIISNGNIYSSSNTTG